MGYMGTIGKFVFANTLTVAGFIGLGVYQVGTKAVFDGIKGYANKVQHGNLSKDEAIGIGGFFAVTVVVSLLCLGTWSLMGYCCGKKVDPSKAEQQPEAAKPAEARADAPVQQGPGFFARIGNQLSQMRAKRTNMLGWHKEVAQESVVDAKGKIYEEQIENLQVKLALLEKTLKAANIAVIEANVPQFNEKGMIDILGIPGGVNKESLVVESAQEDKALLVRTDYTTKTAEPLFVDLTRLRNFNAARANEPTTIAVKLADGSFVHKDALVVGVPGVNNPVAFAAEGVPFVNNDGYVLTIDAVKRQQLALVPINAMDGEVEI